MSPFLVPCLYVLTVFLENSVFTLKDIKYLKEKTLSPEPSAGILESLWSTVKKKRKTCNRSPSTQSVKTPSTKPRLKPKVDTPPKKQLKHEQTPKPTPPLAKPSTSRVKNKPSLPEKEGSVTYGKAPVCSHARKGAKAPIVKVLTLCCKKGVTPPLAVISEDTHANPQGRSPTPITAELMLDWIFTDLPLLSALHLPHKVCCFLLFIAVFLHFPFQDATGCTMCAGCQVLCQHKEPLSLCANCCDWGHCTCCLQADNLQDVHDNLLLLTQAAHPCTYTLTLAYSIR